MSVPAFRDQSVGCAGAATRADGSRQPAEVPFFVEFDVTDSVRATLVVVLDGDPGAAEALAALIGDWGYDCVNADWLEDLASVVAGRRREVLAVICDERLSDGNTGSEAIRRLQTVGVTAPALLLTGTLTARPRRLGRAPGRRLMEKPVPPRRLRAWLDEIMDRQAAIER